MAEAEMIEFGGEQGQMLQVLMRHYQTMKRQETRLRVATAVLLATFLATALWLHFQQQTPTMQSCSADAAVSSTYGGGSPKVSIHLEPNRTEKQPIKWTWMNDGHDGSSENFKLENQRVLQIFTKGLYLINLMLSYRIAYNQCSDNRADQILTLEVNVTQEHSNYENEIVIVSGKESMLCREYWLQSITLTRVIALEANTSLRVRINQDSCKFVNWFTNSHMDVTYLKH